LRIMLVIARKTIGWQKECDLISLTQFEQLTGLSRPSVNATLKLLIERGAVEQTGTGKRGVKCYRLSERLVNSVNQLSRATSKLSEPVLVNSVNQTSPGLVNSVNTQKKDSKETNKRKRESAPAQINLDFLHEGVSTYKRLAGRKPAPIMATLIAQTVTDIPRWERAVDAWIKAGFKDSNIGGMLDWYEHPEKMERKNGTHQNGRIPASNGKRPDLTVRRTRERYDD
jgi:phage replication O-like protein O